MATQRFEPALWRGLDVQTGPGQPGVQVGVIEFVLLGSLQHQAVQAGRLIQTGFLQKIHGAQNAGHALNRLVRHAPDVVDESYFM